MSRAVDITPEDARRIAHEELDVIGLHEMADKLRAGANAGILDPETSQSVVQLADRRPGNVPVARGGKKLRVSRPSLVAGEPWPVPAHLPNTVADRRATSRRRVGQSFSLGDRSGADGAGDGVRTPIMESKL